MEANLSDLHEIVDLNAVNRLFLIFAVISPFAGMLAGYLVGKRSASFKRSFISWTLLGLLGPLNLLMWTLYNSLAKSNGIDSVRNLSLNFFIFITVGGVAGILYHRLQHSLEPSIQTMDADARPLITDEINDESQEIISQKNSEAD